MQTKIVDLVVDLEGYGLKITIFDSWAKPVEVNYEYNLESTQNSPNKKFNAVVL